MLFDLQQEFKRLTIYLNGSKDENLFWNQISSNLGLVEELTIISDTTNPGFGPVFPSWPQNIIILNSYWFTLEYLLTCACTTITLGNSDLENQDLDETLRKWRAGELPNLKCLKIEITDNGTTILGMNLRELNGMIIQTDNGTKKATFRIRKWFEMSVTQFE